MRYIIFSKALHSTWILSHELSALFDCGEGCATTLGHKIFIPDKIFLSHSHIDHISGIPSFLCLRNATKGANDKPLTIYYPAKNNRVEEWINFSYNQAKPLKFAFDIQPIKADTRIEIPQKEGSREKQFIIPFEVEHGKEPCYGYKAITTTKQVKKEFTGRPKEFYTKLTLEEKENIQEEATHNKLFYSGDAMPPRSGPNSPLNNAEIAFLDCTFLSAKDRGNPTHGSMEEIANKCLIADVKTAYAMHLSIRYSEQEIEARINELKEIFPLKPIPYNTTTTIS